MLFSRRAQTIMEYVLLLSILTAALVIMLPRMKRTTQSMIKVAADQIGDQAGAEQTFNDVERGYLVGSNSSTRSKVNNWRADEEGSVYQTYNEQTDTETTSLMNSGWTEE